MRRSEVNAILREAIEILEEHRFHLPPFAFWTPQDWARRGNEARRILARGLGWDITDFGSGDFRRVGLFLFTLRNGTLEALRAGRGSVYAEKIMIVRDHRVTPLHFHWVKTEDIINRGGGNLVLRLSHTTPEGDLASEPVEVWTDGLVRRVPPRGTIVLGPGESITLEPFCYHEFWAEGGTVLVGEVSVVNDDLRDNRFYLPVGRFPQIEEDEPPLHLLVSDYPRLLRALSERDDG